MIATVLALGLAVQDCRRSDTDLPRPFAGWGRVGQSLDTGHATVLSARAGTAETTVRIRKAGTFGIALDQAGWVDVAPPRGRPLNSLANNHGPRCTTIAKIVRYRLQPGAYRVRLTKLKASRVRVMLVHGEAPGGFARRSRVR